MRRIPFFFCFGKFTCALYSREFHFRCNKVECFKRKIIFNLAKFTNNVRKMKNLQIFLFFAVAISVIMAADLKIRNVKGGSSRSRGSSSSSSSRRSGSSGGASSLGNSNVNLGNHAGSFSGVQHSQSQGFQTHHQVSDLSQNSRKIGEKAPPKIDSSSGNKNNQNYKPNEGSARDGIGQMNGAPKQSSGLSPAGSAAVASNSMMFHNHRSNNNGNANKNAGGSSKSTTTTPKSPK